MMDQRRGCRFPVRPRDRNNARRSVKVEPFAAAKGRKEQTNVVINRHPCGPCRHNDGIRGRVQMWNARRHNQSRHVIKRALTGQIPHFEPFGLGGFSCGRVIIPNHRNSTTRIKRPRSRQTRASQPKHRNVLSIKPSYRNHSKPHINPRQSEVRPRTEMTQHARSAFRLVVTAP